MLMHLIGKVFGVARVQLSLRRPGHAEDSISWVSGRPARNATPPMRDVRGFGFRLERRGGLEPPTSGWALQ